MGLLRGGRGWGRGKEGGGYVDKAAGADLVDLRVVREDGDENYVPSMRVAPADIGEFNGITEILLCVSICCITPHIRPKKRFWRRNVSTAVICCRSSSAALRLTFGLTNGSGVGRISII